MIDDVRALDAEGGTLEARSNVPAQSPVFEGHFPGHALVPGVLLIETMAQASGFLLMAREGFRKIPFLVGVKDAKLRTFVEPETALDVTATMEHDGSGFAMTRGAIRSNGKRICEAALTFRITDFPTETLGDLVRARAREVNVPTRFLAAA